MKRLIILLFLFISMTSICSADYELRLNDGITLTWRNYTLEDGQYCTQKDFGKFCIPKNDVVAVREVKDGSGNAPQVSRAGRVAENKEALTVNVASVIPGKIYLDGYYTGKSTPDVVTLSTPGLHMIGLGGDNNRYQELQIKATARQTDVYFEDSGWLPSRTWKILLLSVRNMHLEGDKRAHLTDRDIDEAYNSVLRTSQEWITDFSYGLVKWEVERMTEENVYGYFQYDSGSGKYGNMIDDGRLLKDANLLWLLDKYDSVLVFFPSVPDGADYDPKGGCRGVCCFQATSLSVPNACGRAGKWTERAGNSQIWIHEWLHTVESQFRGPDLYICKGGVHGAQEHGYSADERKGWLPWYKDLMRGQVVEGEKFAGIPPSAWISSTRRKSTAK